MALLIAALALPPLPAAADDSEAAPRMIGEMATTKAHYETNFADLAYLHGLGYIELLAANPGIEPWLPGEGTEVVLPKRHILPDGPAEGIVINLAEPRLYYYPEDGPPRSFPLGIGREGLDTPTGKTYVAGKRKNPAWRPTKEARKEDPSLPSVVRAGPQNPLGAYALDLGWPLYLIHGTNNVWGIGRRVSRGCIRMYPNDIETLYNTVPPRTPVRVVEQPLKFAWVDGTLWMEAHTTTKQAAQLEKNGSFEPDPDLNLRKRVLEVVGKRSAELDWHKIKTAVEQRRGIPLEVGQERSSS
jgi:L,D-transpeptidase ErfK/SrfK